MSILVIFLSTRLPTTQTLINHLKEHHKIPIESTNLKFATFSEFLLWKEAEENRTNSLYVQTCAPQIRGENQHWYYYCNRSGVYQAKGQGKRQLKTQGSSKIGEQCSAHINSTKNLYTGRVSVKYCSTHYNHDIRLAHLRMSTATRLKIAAKLQQGVSLERILDDVRDNIHSEVTREHLVVRQDVHNIKSQYNIEGVMRHANDLSSVSAWVEEMKSLNYNPVLLYKIQGMPQSDEMDNIADQDFVLAIQTEFQRDMLMKFGNNTVCVDATHGTNMYDFHLITILVIDEYGEGIPVVWVITNREDALLLMEFLKEIKKRTGPLTPQWFMSDDADQYFNAWRGVFGENGTKKILCSWHVDRAWRAALHEHITDTKNKVEIYHFLRLLLTKNQESDFQVLLQQFLTFIATREERFHQYFKAEYCTRVTQWASCFRARTTVNTNMFVESFHRVLKVVYLQHKQNRRVDFLLATLMKIARDKTFERLLKQEKGKHTHRVCKINKRHTAAEQMQASQPRH